MGDPGLPTDYARAALASIERAVKPVGLRPAAKLATIARGLTEAEFTRIEAEHSFRFPRVLFDVANKAFWFATWGSRPPAITDALALASERLGDVPVLVPIFMHRYIPSRPHEQGNPILSVMQTDIIYYATDLPSYLAAEFDTPRPAWSRTEEKKVPFWSDLVDLNNL